MNVRYRITLTTEERDELRAFVLAGKGAFRRLKRAQILLASEAGSTDGAIATNIAVGTSTVFRTKRRFVEEGLDAALSELPRPGAERKLAEKEEALLVATACSAPPEGSARWTLALLAGEMVRLTKHRSISAETVRRRLAENELKPCSRRCGASRRSTRNSLREWRTSSICTPRPQTHGYPSSALTRHHGS